VCPLNGPRPVVGIRVRRRNPLEPRPGYLPPMPSGAATCSIGPAPPASSTNGGATSRRASGSLPCATPRAISYVETFPRRGRATRAAAGRRSGPTVEPEFRPRSAHRDVSARGKSGRMDRSVGPALVRVRGQAIPGLTRRHDLIRARGIRRAVFGPQFQVPPAATHLLSFANHDCNAMFQVDGVGPMCAATSRSSPKAMRASAVNTFGGLNEDKARLLDRLARWLPVGFYYKAFHTKRLFPRWERTVFRTLTGLGVVSLDAVRRTTPQALRFLRRSRGRRRVRAAYRRPRSRGGGRARCIGRRIVSIGAPAALSRRRRAARDSHAYRDREWLARHHRMHRHPSRTAYYADHWIALADATRLTKMRAKAVVFAAGVIEQPAVFRHNDCPGSCWPHAASNLAAALPGRAGPKGGGGCREPRGVPHRSWPACAECANRRNRRLCAPPLTPRRQRPQRNAQRREWCSSVACAVRGDRRRADGVSLSPRSPSRTLTEATARRRSRGRIGSPNRHGQAPAHRMRQHPDERGMGCGGESAVAGSRDTRAFRMPCSNSSRVRCPRAFFCVRPLERRVRLRCAGRRPVRAPDRPAAAHAGFGTARDADIVAAAVVRRTPFPSSITLRQEFVDFDEDLQVKDLENALRRGSIRANS